LASILKTPEMQARWQTLGAIPITSTPEQLDAIIRADADRSADFAGRRRHAAVGEGLSAYAS